MAVTDWSTDPSLNGLVDPDLPALDGAPAARIMPFFREVMAGVAQLSKNVPPVNHVSVADADYQVLVTDTQIGFTLLTLPRTIFLPDVDLYPMGQLLFVADETGQCSPERAITISVGSGTSDTIAGQTAIQITDAYQGIGFRRGAANVWIVAR